MYIYNHQTDINNDGRGMLDENGFIKITCDDCGGTNVRLNMGTHDGGRKCGYPTCTCINGEPTGVEPQMPDLSAGVSPPARLTLNEIIKKLFTFSK